MHRATVFSFIFELGAVAVAPGQERAVQPKPVNATTLAQSWTCQPRRTCSQIQSCEEAQWYLSNCSWGGRLDRDNDGIPCESIC
jgi:Excalibur calcium-binding domain